MNLIKRFFHWLAGLFQTAQETPAYRYHWDEADDEEFEYHL